MKRILKIVLCVVITVDVLAVHFILTMLLFSPWGVEEPYNYRDFLPEEYHVRYERKNHNTNSSLIFRTGIDMGAKKFPSPAQKLDDVRTGDGPHDSATNHTLHI